MPDEQHEADETSPANALLDVARAVVPAWLRRITVAAAARGGVDVAPDDPDVDAMVSAAGRDLVARLQDLLETDVDAQRSNPLSLFRAAIAAPTELLRDRDVPVPPANDFDRGHFPDDIYGLGPATWADVDPDLHEPGLTWGAWKAMTVLRRRRDDGLR